MNNFKEFLTEVYSPSVYFSTSTPLEKYLKAMTKGNENYNNAMNYYIKKLDKNLINFYKNNLAYCFKQNIFNYIYSMPSLKLYNDKNPRDIRLMQKIMGDHYTEYDLLGTYEKWGKYFDGIYRNNSFRNSFVPIAALQTLFNKNQIKLLDGNKVRFTKNYVYNNNAEIPRYVIESLRDWTGSSNHFNPEAVKWIKDNIKHDKPLRLYRGFTVILPLDFEYISIEDVDNDLESDYNIDGITGLQKGKKVTLPRYIGRNHQYSSWSREPYAARNFSDYNMNRSVGVIATTVVPANRILFDFTKDLNEKNKDEFKGFKTENEVIIDSDGLQFTISSVRYNSENVRDYLSKNNIKYRDGFGFYV